MKLCCVVAVAVLVVALCSQAQSQTYVRVDECCSNLYRNKVPVRQVKSYKYTNPYCPKKAVIFYTLRGKKVCVDPEEKQIQNIMKKLDGLWPTPSSR